MTAVEPLSGHGGEPASRSGEGAATNEEARKKGCRSTAPQGKT